MTKISNISLSNDMLMYYEIVEVPSGQIHRIEAGDLFDLIMKMNYRGTVIKKKKTISDEYWYFDQKDKNKLKRYLR